mmetsp:Transcript_34019/g.39666  ORF Transcript_34019/g.39666 Transcript_34019/m.39666 type:complete len:242 (+) Transcript_34019:2641-3366(+)
MVSNLKDGVFVTSKSASILAQSANSVQVVSALTFAHGDSTLMKSLRNVLPVPTLFALILMPLLQLLSWHATTLLSWLNSPMSVNTKLSLPIARPTLVLSLKEITSLVLSTSLSLIPVSLSLLSSMSLEVGITCSLSLLMASPLSLKPSLLARPSSLVSITLACCPMLNSLLTSTLARLGVFVVSPLPQWTFLLTSTVLLFQPLTQVVWSNLPSQCTTLFNRLPASAALAQPCHPLSSMTDT